MKRFATIVLIVFWQCSYSRFATWFPLYGDPHTYIGLKSKEPEPNDPFDFVPKGRLKEVEG